jgi:thiosulfate dehydrogenase [quinone] large subunit
MRMVRPGAEAAISGTSPNDAPMALLRIALGLLFLIFASYKIVDTNFIAGSGPLSLRWWLDQFVSRGGAYPFMLPVIDGVMRPFSLPIGVLVAAGELAIGLALVSGVMVRLASVFGVVYMLALLLLTNYPGAGSPLWAYFGRSVGHSVPALCFLAFALGDPARVWSWRTLRRGRSA